MSYAAFVWRKIARVESVKLAMEKIDYGIHFGWVVYLDAFGFRAMKKQNRDYSLLDQFRECHSKINYQLDWAEAPPICLEYKGRDNVEMFFPIPSKNDDDIYYSLQKCFADIQEILKLFFRSGFILRGGVARGDVIYKPNSICGPAYYKAKHYEKIVPAPIVLIPAEELLSPSRSCSFLLPCDAPRVQRIDLKGNKGIIFGAVLCPTPVEDFLQLVEREYQNHGSQGLPKVASAWYIAYSIISSLELERQDNS